jgi:molybdate transport system substrate-binding protein
MHARWLIAASLLTACGGGSANHDTVRIAAASNNAKAFEEVGKAFEAKTGVAPVFTFSSSGMLERQIEQGAPYFVFAAAAKNYAEHAGQAEGCDKSSLAPFARGRLVAWVPKGGQAPKSLEDLADPAYKRIGIANPEQAPYGKAAQQALQKAGVWDRVKDKIILGDSIEATMQFAVTRNVDVALVAQSLAVVNDGGQSLPIDPSLHDPLDEYLVTCGKGEEAEHAKDFVAFLDSADGREIMTRYGFALPSVAPTGTPISAAK